MKLQILSDTHNEFLRAPTWTNSSTPLWGGRIPVTDADIVILAGDIDIGAEGVTWATQESERLQKPIIYVPGNHEYYGGELTSIRSSLFECAKESQKDTNDKVGVYLLDENEIIIQDVRFLGCTLWSDYKADPKTNQSDAMMFCGSRINDHHVIRYHDKPFTPVEALALHESARDWLKLKLSEEFTGKTVVISHHGASLACQHKKYSTSPITGAFLSNLDNLIEMADLWICGHSHSNIDTKINVTRLVSNQYGYHGNEVCEDFNAEFVIELK